MTNLQIEKINQKDKIDNFFKLILIAVGCFGIFILISFFITLIINSFPSIKAFGISFFWTNEWNPNEEMINMKGQFGALPFIVGTLITSILALLISLPFSIAVSVYLGERLSESPMKSILESVIDVLAGIPSVIYGFWGLMVLVPLIMNIEMSIGVIPYGVGILAASLILAIMIIPYSVSLTKQVISMVPNELKEGAYSLGATPFEVTRYVTLPNAKSGIFAGQLMSFGRAISETMAVTMVIGNRNEIPLSIFDPANTLASVIANEFAEASDALYLSSLIQLGLTLLIITTVINLIGRIIIKKMMK
tara:strand:- start:279 stop:1196 length:918 start_codon:yes stop_codon:yes gene_type:complete